MNALTRILSALVLCVACTLCACGGLEPEATITTPPTTSSTTPPAMAMNPYTISQADIVSEGQTIYVQQSCQGCHGTEGQGGLGSVLTDEADSSDEFLFDAIADGIDGTIMTAYSSAITDDEIWKVVTFIRTLEM
ncbi:MAG: c-type cytochrome [Myxococcota bacterium]